MGFLTELTGAYLKKGVASDVIFLMEALNDVLRNESEKLKKSSYKG